ncbi:hypothetical protein [Flavobacterium piscisymbiosum]|uniref:Uncharacterized protein n=1 Tax=Flavobacterium piscisymbiosum TaxID=2893753 RepID=A0ABS8MAY6_9FLAO|nr:hypothetical protein [Flavobacterium sp. F-30]MCC9062685.1 hypothetical protein [Flavobacterium sp. F-30]
MKNPDEIKETASVENIIKEIHLEELKAEIERGKLDIKEGRFITHEEMLIELKNKGII